MKAVVSVHRLTLFTMLMLLFTQGTAQQADTVLNKTRVRIVAVGSGVAYVGSMAVLSNAWYSQYPRQSFRFFNDATEWKQVDKMGHVFSAFHLSSMGSRTLRWTGMKSSRADRIGTITSFVIMSSIEVLDGFSQGYGASASDLVADAAGAGLYLGQQLAWNEIRIHPKFSYHRTSLAGVSPNILGAGLSEELLKDYNGQTYWFSADMDKFMSFPKWLNISLGYGAQNMVRARDYQSKQAGYTPYRQFYLGLDFDLTAIRTRSKFVKSVIYFVNMVRIPAPALELSRGRLKGHWMYF